VISTKTNEWALRQLFAKNALALQSDNGVMVVNARSGFGGSTLELPEWNTGDWTGVLQALSFDDQVISNVKTVVSFPVLQNQYGEIVKLGNQFMVLRKSMFDMTAEFNVLQASNDNVLTIGLQINGSPIDGSASQYSAKQSGDQGSMSIFAFGPLNEGDVVEVVARSTAVNGGTLNASVAVSGMPAVPASKILFHAYRLME
jgi:hypothetical protein